jgi:hypothetical protein
MNTLQKAAADVRQLAQTLFQGGFYNAAGEMAPEFRGEVPLRLMYALRDAGIQRWQLEALTLALRDVGEASSLDAEAPMNPAQQQVLDSIGAEEDLPVVFKALLGAVMPRLRQQRPGRVRDEQQIGKWDMMASFSQAKAV